MKNITRIVVFTGCLSLLGLSYPNNVNTLSTRMSQETVLGIIMVGGSIACITLWLYHSKMFSSSKSRAKELQKKSASTTGVAASATATSTGSAASVWTEATISGDPYVRTERAWNMKNRGLFGRNDVYFRVDAQGINTIGIDYSGRDDDTIFDLKKPIAKALGVNVARITIVAFDEKNKEILLKDTTIARPSLFRNSYQAGRIRIEPIS